MAHKSLTRIRQFLAPPVFQDEDKLRTARLLNPILLTTLAIAAAYGVAALIIYPNPLPVLATIGIVIPLGAGSLFLMRRGHVRLASALTSSVLWVMITLVAVASGGVRSPGFCTYITIILIAGLLLGGRAGIGFAGLSAIAGLGILYAETSNLLPTPLLPVTSVSMWAGLTANFVVAAVLLHLATRSIREALERARRNERDLAQSNEDLRETHASLEERNEQLQAAVLQYVEHMAEIAQGNLAARLAIEEDGRRAEDPLIVLGRNLNDTTASLQRMTIQIRETADNLSSAASEILAATTQQASGASEQSAAIAQASTTIDEVRTIAEQTTRRAQTVADLTRRTADVSQTGQQAVADTITGMREVKEKVETIASNILALSEQAQAIGQIIATVNEIATQSNMLALNAAVEAARAGEAGRGFAVVAGEVRSLAEQSRAATAQVQEILSEIQRGVNAAVMATEEGMKGTDAGVRLTGEAGLVIQKLGDGVTESTQAAVQISAAASQQLAGMEQIAAAMENIHQVTAQSVAGAQQVERAASELTALAGQLRELVEQYQL